MIGEQSSIKTLASLCGVNHLFNSLLTPVLYKRGAMTSSFDPYHRAEWVIRNGRVSSLEKLLLNGLNADTMVPFRHDRLPLLCVSILCIYSEMQKRTPAPNFDIMKLLLSHGADPNQKIFDFRPGVKFMSLLHVVAESTRRHKRYSLITMVIIELLLGNDADINVLDSSGRSPLFYAYKLCGNVKLGNFLRDNGAFFHGDELRRGLRRLSGSGRSHQIQEFLQIRRSHRRYLATKTPKRS